LTLVSRLSAVRLIFPLFLTVFYLPLSVLTVFFKGFTFGVITAVLFSEFGVSGFFIWLICAFPEAAFLFAVLCVTCAAAGEFCAKKPDFSRCSEWLPYVLFLVLCAALCAVLECLLTAVIFRPVSRIF
ncbi:MAG: hypothetical protein ACI4SH_02855, partial [Candidatus Scatosoma sp.]